MSELLITDTLRIFPLPINEEKAEEFILMDNTGVKSLGPGRSLLAKLAASHWGYINGNGFWYEPSTADETIPTWTTPFQKPVLTYHPISDSSADNVIGRILDVRYQKGVAREFVEDDLIPDNKPDGYLEFMTRISDEASIPKVLDRRYDTVSISAIASNVMCSICNKPAVVKDSTCGHTRFARYNKDGDRDSGGKLCYYKAGPLKGRHVAFVISPSDVYAGVQSAEWEPTETVHDSIGGQSLLELFVVSRDEGLAMSLNDGSSVNIFDSFEVNKKAIFDMIYRSDNDVEDKDIENRDNKPGEEERIVSKEITVEDFLAEYIGVAEVDIDKAIEDGTLVLTEDAKLSYKARKNLPDSAFCGPDRSFPAHDASHVRNGLARLNQSHFSPAVKAKILSCLRRRAKKYGIKVSAKVSSSTEDEWKIDEVVVHDILLADATIEEILAMEVMEEYMAANTDNGKAEPTTDAANANATTTDASSATATEPTTTGAATADGGGNNGGDNGKEKVNDAALREAVSERDETIKALTADKAAVHKELKETIVDSILYTRLVMKKVKKEDIEAEREKLLAREVTSLKDTLDDLRVEINQGRPDTPTEVVDAAGVDGDRDPDVVTDKLGNSGRRMSESERRIKHLIPELDEGFDKT